MNLSLYQVIISGAIGSADQAVCEMVEEEMRANTRNGCLDHLSREEIERLARKCWKAISES